MKTFYDTVELINMFINPNKPKPKRELTWLKKANRRRI